MSSLISLPLTLSHSHFHSSCFIKTKRRQKPAVSISLIMLIENEEDEEGHRGEGVCSARNSVNRNEVKSEIIWNSGETEGEGDVHCIDEFFSFHGRM